jgi:8-oxo-dGTP diphosphatase
MVLRTLFLGYACLHVDDLKSVRKRDIAGGHVEPGETLASALAREVREETGWRLRRLVRLIGVVDWEAEQAGTTRRFREFCFLAEVAGDLAAPRLEETKVTEFRWVRSGELELLREHRAPGDEALYELVKRGLELATDRS